VSRVRIHWVSPLPPQETDIAHYTRRILPALAAKAEVVLWTDTPGWDTELERFASVRLFDAEAAVPMDFASLPRGKEGTPAPVEAVFHHIGNSWVFHAAILGLARRVPGTVVLHDLAIQEFLRDIVHNDLFDGNLYREAMIRYHGEAGRTAAEHILDGGPTPDMLERMPMFEIALDHAAAALCHTPAGFERVKDSGLVPVYHADLPFAVSPDTGAERAPDGPLRLVQFGHIGPNRRLEQVLEAWSVVRDEVPFVFDVFGRIWDDGYILSRTRDLGIAERVHFRGFAPEAELDAALKSAHLVFNLRFPTMGEASGSQVRIWNASATAVVTDLGWYASLPDDCVLKIPLDDERPALIETLRTLAADRSLYTRIGTAGRARLLDRHTPEHYADAIVQIARYAEKDARERLLIDRIRNIICHTDPVARSLYTERLIDLI